MYETAPCKLWYPWIVTSILQDSMSYNILLSHGAPYTFSKLESYKPVTSCRMELSVQTRAIQHIQEDNKPVTTERGQGLNHLQRNIRAPVRMHLLCDVLVQASVGKLTLTIPKRL